ncbi:MAG TPA: hypothetical protein DCY48_03865 [Candidatus Magasanikbacteria bacterium]|nr:MAG: hypothetical protein A3I74_01650 [Candidatus Magasanikbacteria bacterium RIFCSPLOWO2_02_FULL_47_16]OGH79861.1 MAG: hypothetical protein A3C10_00150 [Candidatus Magasanikbacteria bacterium RIFCSPHIGHO2_02_FULL_48_18]OGH82101.1 MAG: hypothetical protein A3G08_04365 [Candidatus Magasanikbacteria bacterium RIFCSPLOWO2_12_FULL_47_9b]HAZ28881.1 hypothetical protein [Candidatus Magasanikbacteria bacterium]
MLISTKDIIVQSIHLYQKNYKLFFRYLGLLAIPTVFLTLLGFLFKLSSPERFWTNIIIFLALSIAVYIVSLWLSLALTRVIALRQEQKQPQDIPSELKFASSILGTAIAVSLLIGIIVLGGIILFLIPGIIFAIWFAFSLYAVILDNQKAIPALKTSKHLVSGRLGAVFVRLLVPNLLFGIVLLAFQYIIQLPLTSLSEAIFSSQTGIFAGTLAAAALGSVAGLFLTPLSIAAPVILYMNLQKNPIEKTNA